MFERKDGAKVLVEVKLDFEELRNLRPDQVEAIMKGIAEVLNVGKDSTARFLVKDGEVSHEEVEL